MKFKSTHTESFLNAISESCDKSLKFKNFHYFKADWLLNSFTDDTWILKKHNSYFDKQSKKWNQIINIHWGTILPNKKSLISKEYSEILNTIKKVVFLSRQGYEILSGGDKSKSETTRSQQQYDLAKSLVLIIQWMINNKYSPEHTGFQVLTITDLVNYVSDLKFGAQFCNGTYSNIEEFLENNKQKNRLKDYLIGGKINYKLLSKKLDLGCSNRSFIPSIRLQKALNKYETTSLPKWIDYTYSNNRTELISSRAQSFTSHASQPITTSALSGYLLGFKAIGRFASILPELSGLDWCDDLKINHLADTYGFKEKSRTPTIPISTALEYLDHSIAWVENIGADLVSLKHKCDSELLNLLEGTNARKDHFAKKISPKIPPSLAKNLQNRGLEIKRYNANPSNTSYAQIRDNLSVEEAVDCLVAACYVLIGTFTCKRISEVLDLTRNCSRPALDGGWELVFGLRKSSPVESLSMIGRPIPDIVNAAIDLLCELAPARITHLQSDPNKSPIFLSNYRVNRQPIKATQMGEASLYKSLELFSDVIQIRPDKKNRRWYIRSHELRRFFAISYFWHDRHTGLPALSWFMGHTDIEQTLRYITEEIAGAEITEEEARFSASIILENKEDTIPGIESLTSLSRSYFKTENLNMIDQHRLESYLTQQFKNGFRIEKHKHGARIIYLEEYSL